MKRFLSAFCILLLVTHLTVPASAANDSITTEEIADAILYEMNTSYSDLFTQVEIQCGPNFITVYVECAGLASTLQAAHDAGYDETYFLWVLYKEALLQAYNHLADILESYGKSNLHFDMWLCNDDINAGRRSRFGRNLASISNRESIMDYALQREEDPPQDISTLPEDIQQIYTTIKALLELAGFDYINIYYVEQEPRFFIEVAIDGLGEAVYLAKKAGLDEQFAPWAEMRGCFLMAYQILHSYLASIGRSDIGIILQLENDEVVIHGYHDRLDFTPLLEANNMIRFDTITLYDIFSGYNEIVTQ